MALRGIVWCTKRVLKGAAVTLVICDEDGEMQFHDSKSRGRPAIVHFDHLLDYDETLADIPSLARRQAVQREGVGRPWEFVDMDFQD